MKGGYVITAYGEGEEWPDGTEYYAPAGDLGALGEAGAEIAREYPPGEYSIEIGDDRWGVLAVEAPGRWSIRSDDGSVTVLPNAIIL